MGSPSATRIDVDADGKITPEEMAAGLGGAFVRRRSGAVRQGRPPCRLQGMQVIRATVRDGRIVVDEPTTFPDGHEVAPSSTAWRS